MKRAILKDLFQRAHEIKALVPGMKNATIAKVLGQRDGTVNTWLRHKTFEEFRNYNKSKYEKHYKKPVNLTLDSWVAGEEAAREKPRPYSKIEGVIRIDGRAFTLVEVYEK